MLLYFFLFEWVPAMPHRLTSNSRIQVYLLPQFLVAAGTTGVYHCIWHSCRYSKSLYSLTQRPYTGVHGLDGSEHTKICWIIGKSWCAVWFAIFSGDSVQAGAFTTFSDRWVTQQKVKKQLSEFIHFSYSPFRSDKVYSLHVLFPCITAFPISYSCKPDFAEVKDQSVGFRSWPFFFYV